MLDLNSMDYIVKRAEALARSNDDEDALGFFARELNQRCKVALAIATREERKTLKEFLNISVMVVNSTIPHQGEVYVNNHKVNAKASKLISMGLEVDIDLQGIIHLGLMVVNRGIVEMAPLHTEYFERVVREYGN